MIKLITIIGARPQFIKAAAVSRAVRSSDKIKEVIIHTGQHFDENMSSIFFKEMDIPAPHYNLEVNNLSHGAMTGRMMESIEKVLLKEKPDLVMVYGDTNSTLAGALTARKLNIAVAHVEAGLRSFNMKMPEEINRILTDRISDLLFCPTENAVKNLYAEGFENFKCRILKVGDVMYDAALYYGAKSLQYSDIVSHLGLSGKAFVLCSVHRQENTDDQQNLKSILKALNDISRKIHVVFPLHPRTKKIIKQYNISLDFEPINPVGYFDIIELIKNCGLIITDSGGMQKEAYFFKKYCLTLRNETEWVELIDNSYNFLVGYNSTLIKLKVEEFVGREIESALPLFGNGDAAQLIINSLTD